MKIAKLAVLLAISLAMPAVAQPARPAAPKPCVLMPRQGSGLASGAGKAARSLCR